MLSPEAAAKQLEQWQIAVADDDEEIEVDSNWLDLIRRFPKASRAVGFALLGRNADGEEIPWQNWQESESIERKAGQTLDEWSPTQRKRLFEIFFPSLAAAVELAWQAQILAPFGFGRGHRAFRSPRTPSLSLPKRMLWLKSMINLARHYSGDVVTVSWLAAWAPHIRQRYQDWQGEIGVLLSAVIDAGGPLADEVLQILIASLLNQHEIGGMGKHVIVSLLSSSQPTAWESIEKTLLAAQRQEGLRQAILNEIDEAPPEAFRRMLRLIRDNELARFSAVAQALNDWLGYYWDSASVKTINAVIERLLECLEDEGVRTAALSGKNAEDAYLALWATAFEDVHVAMDAANELLNHPRVEHRYVAVLFLRSIDLPNAFAIPLEALEDEDLRVAWCALESLHEESDIDSRLPKDADLFGRLETLLARTPQKPQKLKPLVWPWGACEPDQRRITRLMLRSLGDRSPAALLPHLESFERGERESVATLLGGQEFWDSATRKAILDFVGDPVAGVRTASCKALAGKPLEAGDAERLEGYLSRKAPELRRGIVAILRDQSDAAAIGSAHRLLAAKDALQRLAGLELLRQLCDAERLTAECQSAADEYRQKRSRITKEEATQLDAIRSVRSEACSLDNALGLIDPADRTPPIPPKGRNAKFITPAAVAYLKSLDELVHEHREERVQYEANKQSVDQLLGQFEYGFPTPNWREPQEKCNVPFPLRKIWEQWSSQRGKSMRDADGLELFRAHLWSSVDKEDWDEWKSWGKRSAGHRKLMQTAAGGLEFVKLRYRSIVRDVLEWLVYLNPPAGAVSSFLDATETIYSLVPAELNQRLVERSAKTTNWWDPDDNDAEPDWRGEKPAEFWTDAVGYAMGLASAAPTSEEKIRYWQLLHWRDEPISGADRDRPNYSILADGYVAGAASKADWFDHLLGRRPNSRWEAGFSDLRSLTLPRHSKEWSELLKQVPDLVEIVEQSRQRTLELELSRGEEPTAATSPAMSLGSVSGSATLIRILTLLGKRPFRIESTWYSDRPISRGGSLSNLARVAFPDSADTPVAFSKMVQEATAAGHFPDERILELAFHAPQWSRFIESHLGWNGFCEGLYWFLAHMKYLSVDSDQVAFDANALSDNDDSNEDEDDSGSSTSAWDRLIAERTPLDDEARREGAVDVNWFHRIYSLLTPKRWETLAKAARYASSPAQSKRAQFVADVLLGKASRKELIEGIRKKYLKENVRLLGLLPLATGTKRDGDLTERYKVLVEYRKYAKQLSAMSKEDAVRASEVGFQNLARTAGYADPLRLEWAMEAENVKDLSKGSVEAVRDGVTVRLELDESSRPTLTVRRGEKELKSIPPEIKKKDKAIAALAERVPELKRQTSRMRQSLEAAMCRGDVIMPAELVQLCDHALLKPMLSRLVLVGDGILGYPDKGGKALRNAAGKLEPIKKAESLRIAHPHDLFASGDWDAWQRDCFQAERVQPFKQIFRELYVVTKQEKSDGTQSRRYAGQQVNPSQATALWGQRGWSTKDGVWKTFYDVGITASVGFNYGITTPLEVEGWTIETIQFTQRDSYERLKLTAVPPRIFSEVMRDLDLVVSVAHRGQVDPEASASTVEMRANLLDEACRLLQLKNVRIKNQHALVDGELGKYSVHLGSAVVHKMPGGSLCIVPVHAQHRGRLFLPFADDDPKTAEVISKVLLLARDAEIQDPIILDQLRHVGV